MKTWVLFACVVFLLCMPAFGQQVSANPQGNNVGIAWTGTTGDPGTNGVRVFGGLWLRSFELAAEFTHSAVNIKTASLVIKTRQEDVLAGPRLYLGNVVKNSKFVPFGHLLFGYSHENSDVTGLPVEESDNAYSWDFGGGIDYHFNPRWSGRLRADVFRTHFRDDSQTHARYGFGVVYTFGK